MDRYSDVVDPLLALKWIEPMRCTTGHNVLCEICHKTFPNGAGSVLSCIYCNVITHVKCLVEFHKKLNPSKEWICFYCIDYLDESKKTHRTKQESNRNHGKFTKAQVTIAKYWRRYADRKFYIRIYNLIIYLQVRFRVNKRKHSFHKQVQGKLRPFHLRITRCSSLNLDLSSKKGQAGKVRRDSAAGAAIGGSLSEDLGEQPNFVYVIATMLDFSKGHLSQTWQITTDVVPVVPSSGVSRHATAVRRASTAAVSEGAQASKEGKDGKETEAAGGTQQGRSSNPSQQGAAQAAATYHYFNAAYGKQPKHLYFDCSVLLGGVSGYQYVVLSVFQRGSYSRDLLLGQTYVDLSQGMLWKRGGTFRKPLEPQDFAVKDEAGIDLKTDCRARPQGSIDFELVPVQGLCTGCGVVYGPCVEDLVRAVSLQSRFPGFTVPKPTGGAQERRKYAVGSNQMGYGSSVGLHTKKSWIAIADGRIYMYGHFGDSVKVRINVEFFSFYAAVRNRTVVYVLRSNDFPDLEFYTSSKEEELRWKCAFLTTFRARNATPSLLTAAGGSEAHGAGGVGDTQSATSAGAATSASALNAFDTRSLIRDLALVEVSRYNGKDSALIHFHSPPSSTAVPAPSPVDSSPAGGSVKAKREKQGGGDAAPHLTKAPAHAEPKKKVRMGGDSVLNANESGAGLGSPLSSPLRPPRAPHSSPLPAVHASPAGDTGGWEARGDVPKAPLPSSVSTSSFDSTLTGDADSAAETSQSVSRKTRKAPAQLATTSAALALAAAAANSRSAVKGLFDEIDQEIAEIQAAKSLFLRDPAEDKRVQDAQQEHAHQHRSSHHTAHPRHALHDPQLRLHPQGRPLQRAGQCVLSSSRSSTADTHTERGTAHHHHHGSRDGQHSLQGIREAVSDIYEVEEGILNETLGKVGGDFVAQVLTSLLQKKHAHR